MAEDANDLAQRIIAWLRSAYGAGHQNPQPRLAQRLLDENPAFGELAPYAAGNLEGIKKNPQATNGMPPLVAVTHSSLSRLRPADFEACAAYLIAGGADVNASRIDPGFPGAPLSALYGAAGRNHQPGLTKLLLDAGANPNDGESLYHSLETRDTTCTRLLLAAGATPQKTNALNKSLDVDHLAATQLLLDAGADPNEGVPALFWAIRRWRSLAHVTALLRAGADPRALHRGITPYRAAMYAGLPEVAARLREITGEPESQDLDRFLACCSNADRQGAEAMLREKAWIQELPPAMHSLLPDLVEAGNRAAAKLMVELGWPIAARGGDWNASALNLAVFRGDPELTAFLLAHGASWEERHGYNDDVRGTLSFASVQKPVAHGDWLGCARVLVAAGMPKPSQDYDFPEALRAYFDQAYQ